MSKEKEEIEIKSNLEEPVQEELTQIKNNNIKTSRINFNVVKFERRLNATISVIFKSLLIILTAIGLIFIHRELSSTNYSIQHISVPASFEESGYTGPVIANRIFNRLNNIIQSERLADVATEYKNANSVVDLNVDLVGIGVPVRSFIRLLGESLGINNRKDIECDIVIDADTLICELRIIREVERHKVLLNGGIESAMGKLSNKAAESILKHTSPYVLARYYLLNDSEGSFDLGKYILNNHSGNPDIEPIGYFAMAGGFLTEGKFELAEKEARKGLEKYNQDLNLHAALGTMLLRQRKFDEALHQGKKIISLLKKNTPLNRVTRSYANLGYIMSDMGNYDSAIYYHDISLQVDKKFSEGYLSIGELYLLKRDTTKSLYYLEKGLDIGLNPKEVIGRLSDYQGYLNDSRLKELLKKYPVE